MPFWLHGRDTVSGQPRDPLFVEVEGEDDARQQAAAAGMTVEEVEFVRPPLRSGTPGTTDPVAPLRCARCGSDRVVPRATIWDQGEHSGGTLQAYVYANPAGLVFRGTAYATLYARVCAACGHAELFADGAEGLYEAYRRSRAEETA